ncbi:MAG: hypothetical protein P4L50_08935 [Anaerolineaceae bacterium]|nr:hypothetical protein [Anaerolineaceae bacterium]
MARTLRTIIRISYIYQKMETVPLSGPAAAFFALEEQAYNCISFPANSVLHLAALSHGQVAVLSDVIRYGGEFERLAIDSLCDNPLLDTAGKLIHDFGGLRSLSVSQDAETTKYEDEDDSDSESPCAAKFIATAMQGSPELERISVSSIVVGGDDTKLLISALIGCPLLWAVRLSNCGLTQDDLSQICVDWLGKNHTLRELYLDENRLSNEEIEVLALGFASGPKNSLKALSIRYASIGAKAAPFLVQLLEQLRGLTTFRIGENRVCHGCLKLFRVFAVLKSLRILDVAGNKAGKDGAYALSSSLPKSVQKLILRENRFGPEGMSTLSPALGELHELTQLDLAGNNLGQKGAAALVPALERLSLLRVLDLSANELCFNGAKSLMNAVKKKKLIWLCTLRMGYNRLGATGVTEIAPAIARLKRLERLDLSHNEMGGKGAVALAAAVGKLSRLAMLNVSFNSIDSVGVKALINATQQVKELVLSGNSMAKSRKVYGYEEETADNA